MLKHFQSPPISLFSSTEVLIYAFISSRTDYGNALLSGLPVKSE